MSSARRTSHILWLLAATVVALQWIVVRLAGLHLPNLWVTVLSGVGIFGAAEPGLYRTGLLYLVPPAQRPRAREAVDVLAFNLRWWLVGQAFLMVIMWATTTAGLWLLYRLLGGVARPEVRRRFLLLLVYASMFPNHQQDYYGEVFTAVSLLIGIGIGVGVGMLLAPASGEETRRKIQNRFARETEPATGTYGM